MLSRQVVKGGVEEGEKMKEYWRWGSRENEKKNDDNAEWNIEARVRARPSVLSLKRGRPGASIFAM